MTKIIRDTGPAVRRIRDTGEPQPRTGHEEFARAIGAHERPPVTSLSSSGRPAGRRVVSRPS